MELLIAFFALAAAVIVPVLLWYFSPEPVRRWLRSRIRTGEPEVAGAPLVDGWQAIDPSFLGSLAPLTTHEAIAYFDGAVPTWRHAVSDVLPRREAVDEILHRLSEAREVQYSAALRLIRAAGGEGKSTILMQAAADAARGQGWAVLGRSSPSVGLSVNDLAVLDPLRHWLFVADDAESLVGDLVACARWLHEHTEHNVYFLLAARDTDWLAAKGDKQPWTQWIARDPDVVVRGISQADADAVVTAWDYFGAEGLRILADVAAAERTAALVAAVAQAAQKQGKRAKTRRVADGSFFGGLLQVRFGQEGLRAHLRSLLARVETISLVEGTGTLFDALVYIAACHGIGTEGIDARVLADLLAVPREKVQREVVLPLGEEAAAVYAAGRVATRHTMVASALLALAEESFGVDLAETWTQLVHQTVLTGNDFILGPPYGEVIHAGPRLEKALPTELVEARRQEIAVAAAKAACEYKSERLDCVVDLGKTYRVAGEYEEARQVFRRNADKMQAKVDYREVVRGYYYEWGLCEGLAAEVTGSLTAGAWLQGLSLEDHLDTAPVTNHQVSVSCAGLALALGKLTHGNPTGIYGLGSRAAVVLGCRAQPDARTAANLRRNEMAADAIGTPHPGTIVEAREWLASAVRKAGVELRDPVLSDRLDPDAVSFSLLGEFMLTGGKAQQRGRRGA